MEERKRERNIEPLPSEFYAVSQTTTRKYQIEALCADGQVAIVKSGMSSISEAKKALMGIWTERKGSARVEFIHPQLLWEKNRAMRGSIDRDISVQESGSRRNEQKQDKPDVLEINAEHHKRKSR